MTKLPDEAARSQKIKEALAAAAEHPDPERIRIPWRSGSYVAPVVDLPVDHVLLNPRSHRIRAELEASPDRELVRADPYGKEAQAVVEDLLRRVEKYRDLMRNLEDEGQADPGIVSRSGVLINANTRCVALRDLGKSYIRAAVLPSDASVEEIDRLELRLQMRRDFVSEYTFTNELLFIEDLVQTYGYTFEEIAQLMNWVSPNAAPEAIKKAALEARRRVRALAFIRDVQRISGNRIPITHFDALETRQAFLDLIPDYEKIEPSDPDAARSMLEMRLAGMLVGVGYRELRSVNDTFAGEYLVPALEEHKDLSPFVEQLLPAIAPCEPPLDSEDVFEALEPRPQTEGRRTAKQLLEIIAQTHDDETLELQTPEGAARSFSRYFFLDELRAAVDDTAKLAKVERSSGDALNKPARLLTSALKSVRAAQEASATARLDPEFDSGKVLSMLDDLAACCDGFRNSLIQ